MDGKQQGQNSPAQLSRDAQCCCPLVPPGVHALAPRDSEGGRDTARKALQLFLVSVIVVETPSLRSTDLAFQADAGQVVLVPAAKSAKLFGGNLLPALATGHHDRTKSRTSNLSCNYSVKAAHFHGTPC